MKRWRSIGGVVLGLASLALAALLGAGEHNTIRGAPDMAPDTPAGVRFVTVALGGFRGLLSDFLWVRASDLQERGRFFEVAQLADWITRLEPRSPEVWVYHAWNMAYNIPSVLPDAGDRWHWVRNGMRLLRDEGLRANPATPKLYWELGWLFYDKVGGHWDEATLFYRVGWAGEMMEAWPMGMADYAALDQRPEAVKALATLSLDPAVMKAVDAEYGPLDWRLPESQALYWGFRGQSFKGFDASWCERLVWMALTESVKGGTLAFSPGQHVYLQGPRLDVAVKGIRRCGKGKIPESGLARMATVNFLRESVLFLHAFQRPAEAKEALAALKRIPEAGPVVEPVEKFVMAEAKARIQQADTALRRKRISEWLVQAGSWRKLDVPYFADGFERLARLFWEASGFDAKGEADWDGMRREAHAVPNLRSQISDLRSQISDLKSQISNNLNLRSEI